MLAGRDEAADDRSHDRAQEVAGGEDGDGEPAAQGVEEVDQIAADNRRRRRCAHAAQEATDDDGREILGDGHGDLEDDEEGVADEQRDLAAVELAHGPPDDGAEDEA